MEGQRVQGRERREVSRNLSTVLRFCVNDAFAVNNGKEGQPASPPPRATKT